MLPRCIVCMNGMSQSYNGNRYIPFTSFWFIFHVRFSHSLIIPHLHRHFLRLCLISDFSISSCSSYNSIRSLLWPYIIINYCIIFVIHRCSAYVSHIWFASIIIFPLLIFYIFSFFSGLFLIFRTCT